MFLSKKIKMDKYPMKGITATLILTMMITGCAEKERYYLHGIHFTPEHTEVTNGHYLARVSTPFSGKTLKEALNDLPKVEGYEPKKDGEECFTFPASACEVRYL